MKCGHPSRLTGAPCQRDVAPGFNRCYLHGGATPGAKLAAERALAVARMPAIEALHQILHDWDAAKCQVCGRPNFENAHPVIRAAIAILDRAGFGPKATLEVTKPEQDGLDVDQLNPAERAELLALLAGLDDLKERVRLRLAGEAETPSPAPLALAPGPVALGVLGEALGSNVQDAVLVSPEGETGAEC
jgi:hypothetical protein